VVDTPMREGYSSMCMVWGGSINHFRYQNQRRTEAL